MALFNKKKDKEEDIIEQQEEQDFPTIKANPIRTKNNEEPKEEKPKEEVNEESKKEESKEESKEEKEITYTETFNEEDFLEYYNIVRESENIKLFLKVSKGREEYEKLMKLEEIYNKHFNKEDK